MKDSTVSWTILLMASLGQVGQCDNAPPLSIGPWLQTVAGLNANLRDGVSAGSKAVVVGDIGNEGGGVILTSDDGRQWQDANLNIPYPVTDVAHGNGQFLALAVRPFRFLDSGHHTIFSSPSGDAWAIAHQGEEPLHGLVWGADVFVTMAYRDGRLLYSTNGTAWTPAVVGISDNGSWYYDTRTRLLNLLFTGGRFFATGGNDRMIIDGQEGFGVIATSTNGTSWQAHRVGRQSLTDVAFGNNVFVAVGYSSALRSSDGLLWQTYSLPGVAFRVFFQTRFVIPDLFSPRAMVSADGSAWQFESIPITASFADGAKSAANNLVMAGERGQIASLDCANRWWVHRAGTASRLRRVLYHAGGFIAMGDAGTLLRAEEGVPLEMRWTDDKPEIRIYGTVGKSYRIEYQTALSRTAPWISLENVTVGGSPQTYMDVNSTGVQKRFYRAVELR